MCSPFLVPDPQRFSSDKKSDAIFPVVTAPDSTIPDTIDFDDAFYNLPQHSEVIIPERQSIFYRVTSDTVRIALERNSPHPVFYSSEPFSIYDGRSEPGVLRGKIEFRKTLQDNCVLVNDGHSYRVSLPCTLYTSETGQIEFNQSRYRGYMIVTNGENIRRLQIINVLGVEQYLRGVVPLEIGRRDTSFIEALKAQAVAARTYTYKRIFDRSSFDYDMLSTVADQVYGGASVEYGICDQAIAATKNCIMVYGDTIIEAYYHSTCGGKTANIEDVWNRSPKAYLRSVNDTDSGGVPYCLGSSSYNWEETWSSFQLSTILHKSASPRPRGEVLLGPLEQISVKNRFTCGRVGECILKSRTNQIRLRGDEIRFVFRRSVPGNPILKSARFTIKEFSSSRLVLSGSGYGHGVGMCQFGALGRASAGKSFSEILYAYYPGVTLQTVKIDRFN